MLDALDKTTFKSVSSESLKYIKAVNKDNYKCEGCSVNLIPCAYQSDSKVRPYFKLFPGKGHEKDCTESKYLNYTKIASTRQISSGYDFPIPYVNKLVVEDEARLLVSDNSVNTAKNINRYEYGDENENKANVRTRNLNTTTIKKIVRHYIDFQNDLHLSLHVPGVQQNSYGTVFKKLNYKFRDGIRGLRIYYGFLYFSTPPIRDNNTLTIKLAEGTWKKEKSNGKEIPKLDDHLSLVIDVSNWSPAKIELIINMIEYTQEELKKNKNKSYKGYIFFLGQPQPSDNRIYTVSNHRFIFSCCCREL